MSTAPEDNTGPEDTTRSPEGGQQPKFEPGIAPEATATTEDPEDPRSGAEGAGAAPEESGSAPAEPRPGGALSAETLSIVGLVLLGVTVLSGQLLEILTSMILIGGQAIDPGQIRQIEMQIWMGGALALLTVLSSALALALTNAGTRPWARWAGTATTIAGLLFVAVAAVSYLLIPEAAPQMMPPIMD